jgi:hypothetical protein
LDSIWLSDHSDSDASSVISSFLPGPLPPPTSDTDHADPNLQLGSFEDVSSDSLSDWGLSAEDKDQSTSQSPHRRFSSESFFAADRHRTYTFDDTDSNPEGRLDSDPDTNSS